MICVCACVCARDMCVCDVCVRAICVCMCVRACVRACVYVCVYVRAEMCVFQMIALSFPEISAFPLQLSLKINFLKYRSKIGLLSVHSCFSILGLRKPTPLPCQNFGVLRKRNL